MGERRKTTTFTLDDPDVVLLLDAIECLRESRDLPYQARTDAIRMASRLQGARDRIRWER
jgi:hypothetical protein